MILLKLNNKTHQDMDIINMYDVHFIHKYSEVIGSANRPILWTTKGL